MGFLGILITVLPHSSRILTLVDLTMTAILYIITLALLKLIKEKDVDILLGALPENKGMERISGKLRAVVVKLNHVL
jgi:hypothetical protein